MFHNCNLWFPKVHVLERGLVSSIRISQKHAEVPRSPLTPSKPKVDGPRKLLLHLSAVVLVSPGQEGGRFPINMTRWCRAWHNFRVALQVQHEQVAANNTFEWCAAFAPRKGNKPDTHCTSLLVEDDAPTTTKPYHEGKRYEIYPWR